MSCLEITKIIYDISISLFNKYKISLQNRIQLYVGIYFCFVPNATLALELLKPEISMIFTIF